MSSTVTLGNLKIALLANSQSRLRPLLSESLEVRPRPVSFSL